MPSGDATLTPINSSGINAKIHFEEQADLMIVTGEATGMQDGQTYVSLAYGLKSQPAGPTPCRDDGTLGGPIVDAVEALQDLLPIDLGGLTGQILRPEPGSVIFSPSATARMFLGVWNPQKDADGKRRLLAIKPTKGANGLSLKDTRTVSVRQPQAPTLKVDIDKDIRPQVFQLRACAEIIKKA